MEIIMASKLNRKNLAKNRSVKYVDNDGKNRLLKVKSSCNTFGGCIIDINNGDFLYEDGMKKCLKCSPAEKSACIVKSDPKIAYVKNVKIGKSFVGKRGVKDQFGNFSNTGTHTINMCLLSGKNTVEQIAKKIGSPVSRVKTHFYTLTKKKGYTITASAKGLMSINAKLAA